MTKRWVHLKRGIGRPNPNTLFMVANDEEVNRAYKCPDKDEKELTPGTF